MVFNTAQCWSSHFSIGVRAWLCWSVLIGVGADGTHNGRTSPQVEGWSAPVVRNTLEFLQRLCTLFGLMRRPAGFASWV
jgi:hypothetical protein